MPQETVFVRNCPVAKQDISLCYETFGSKADPSVVLVPGVNNDMKVYTDAFCADLVKAGPFHVVRYDQRDAGGSSVMTLPGPAIPRLLIPEWMSVGEQLAYTLPDLSLDLVALMDKVGIEAAHLVGETAGGRIAQMVAHRCPDRVRSLGFVMSTNGAKDLPKPSSEARSWMMKTPASKAREDVVSCRTDVFKNCLATGAPESPEVLRAMAEDLYDRSPTKLEFNTRPIAAVIRSEAQEEANKAGKIPETVPVVVLHGDKDIMMAPVHGQRLAASIKQARLVTIPDMGHYMHPKDYGLIIGELVGNMKKAVQ